MELGGQRDDLSVSSALPSLIKSEPEEQLIIGCPLCPEEFADCSLLKCHIAEAHCQGGGRLDEEKDGDDDDDDLDKYDSKLYKCPHCSLHFDSDTLMSHVISLLGGRRLYFCEVCHKGFDDEETMAQHRPLHDCVGSQFRCNICRGAFTRSYRLRRHLYYVHGDTQALKQAPHRCEECDVDFAMNWQLVAHRKSHENAPATCTLNPAMDNT